MRAVACLLALSCLVLVNLPAVQSTFALSVTTAAGASVLSLTAAQVNTTTIPLTAVDG